MTDAQWDLYRKAQQIKEEYAEYCVIVLNRLVEELPLEHWVKQGVKAGKFSPKLYRELFATGEGSGWDDTEGMNLRDCLNAWFASAKVIDAIIEIANKGD